MAIYVHDFQTLITTKKILKIGCDNPTSFHWNFQNQSKLTQFKQYLIDLSNFTLKIWDSYEGAILKIHLHVGTFWSVSLLFSHTYFVVWMNVSHLFAVFMYWILFLFFCKIFCLILNKFVDLHVLWLQPYKVHKIGNFNF